MRPWFLSWVLADIRLVASVETVDHGLVDWLNSREGGYFNPKQKVRREDPEDPTSMVGVFATESIEEGALLCQVPWVNLITPDTHDDPEDAGEEIGYCRTVRNLAREMRLGKESEFAPYVSCLQSQKEGQIPSAWSDAGKEFLIEILGGIDQRIPPESPVSWLETMWYGDCDASRNDAVATNAAILVVQRADDDIMVPLYDMYNHRNGRWYNSRSKTNVGVNHQLRAGRTIEAGEQIYNSYNMCDECGGRSEKYGTPGKSSFLLLSLLVCFFFTI
jgi:hypothetical protein